MGTNYYFNEKLPCPACGHQPDPLHIGKSSAGWVFALHVVPEKGINSLDDWRDQWFRPGVVIENEHGDTIVPGEMEGIITKRRWHSEAQPWTEAEYGRNEAEPGPNGLARGRISTRVIGHGEGTWDLMLGEFS